MLSSKVYVVTGGNSGLGFETARRLAKQGNKVIIASRNKTKANEAIQKIGAEYPTAKVEFQFLDLSSIQGSVDAAATIKSSHPRLDCIIANSGIFAARFETTTDGYENQFAINHLGHFAFIDTLLPLLEQTANTHGHARVVIVSSNLHEPKSKEGIDFENLKPLSGRKDPANIFGFVKSMDRYNRSKYASILHAFELDKRLRQRGIRNVYVNSVHPGIIADTNLTGGDMRAYLPRWFLPIFLFLNRFFSISIEEGAKTQLYLATSPDVVSKEIHGQYWSQSKNGPVKGVVRGRGLDRKLATRLWENSEQAVKEHQAS